MQDNSNSALVIEYMNEHGSITSMEAFEHLNVTRLSGVIWSLKKQGVEIKTETTETTETIESFNTHGRKIHFAKYSLKGED